MKAEREVLGRQLRRAREGRGLSQSDLTRQSGVTQARISKIESGALNFEINTLLRLAQGLKMTLWQILRPEGVDA